MTFREFHVLLRLYRDASPELRAWADKQLPELGETAKMTEGSRLFDHRIAERIELPAYGRDVVSLMCTCGAVIRTTCAEAADDFIKHASK